MIKSFSKTFINSQKWIGFLLVFTLMLGIFFRLVNLDKKPYWADENFTSSVISGYSYQELIDKFSNGQPVSVGEFLSYLYPNRDRNLGDTLKIISTKDTHPPLYYLMTRFWVQWFGNSIAVIRSLSAVISILTLPLMYWLCLELFGSQLTGWVGAALMAVSPFHVLFAQEARQYSFLTLAIVFASAALLRVVRTKTKLVWGIYAIALLLGFYSHLFFFLVAIGYAIYIVVIERFRLTQTTISFFLVSFLSFIGFLPWVVNLFINFSSFKGASSWISTQDLSLLGAIRLWADNICLAFFDLWIGRYFQMGKYSLYFLIPPILSLVGYSLYFLYKNTQKQVYLFVFILMGTTASALILADLILGGNRQIWPRYIIACYIGIQLAVAYCLSSKIVAVSPQIKIATSSKQQKIWQIILLTVITSGIIACIIHAQAETWWNKYGGEINIEISHVINRAEQPLVIIDRKPTYIIPISYSLDANVQLQFITQPKNLKISNTIKKVFLVNPTAQLKDELRQQNYQSSLIANYNPSGMFQGMELWKAEKIN